MREQLERREDEAGAATQPAERGRTLAGAAEPAASGKDRHAVYRPAMRRWPLLLALVLGACSRQLANPLDPEAQFALRVGKVEQVGVHAVRVSVKTVAVASVKAYRVYRDDGSGTSTPVGDVLDPPELIDRSVEPGKSYRYSVRAVGATGESATSQPVGVSVLPTPPVTLAVEQVGIGRLRLTVGPAVAWIHQVAIAASAAGLPNATKLLAAGVATADLDVDEAHDYTLAATPRDAVSGDGPVSTATVSVRTPPPGDFTVLRPLAAPDTAHATWLPVAGVDHYLLGAAINDTFDERARPASTSADVTGLSTLASYRWHVSAVGANGKATAPSQTVETPAAAWTRLVPGGVSDAPPPDARAVWAFVWADGDGRPSVDVAFQTAGRPGEGDTARLMRLPLQPVGPWKALGQIDRLVDGAAFAGQPPTGNASSPSLWVAFPSVTGTLRALLERTLEPGALDVEFPLPTTPNVALRTGATATLMEGTDGPTLVLYGGRTGPGLTGKTVTIRLGGSPVWAAPTLADGVPSEGHGAAALGDSLYVFGGRNAEGTTGPTVVLKARPLAGEGWTALAAPRGAAPSPRFGLGAGMAASEDGTAFHLVGGLKATDASPLPSTTLHTFTPATNRWSQTAVSGTGPAPGPVALVAAPFGDPGTFLAFDGSGGFLLEPGLDPKWERIDAPPTPRTGAAVAYDRSLDRVFAFGGLAYGPAGPADSSELWVLTPDDALPWRRLDVSPAPPARTGAALAFSPDDATLFLSGGSQTDRQLASLRLDTPSPHWTFETRANPPPSSLQGAVLAVAPTGTGGTNELWFVGCGTNDTYAGQAFRTPTSVGGSPPWVAVATGAAPIWHDTGDCAAPPVSCYDQARHTVFVVGTPGRQGQTVTVHSLALSSTTAWKAVTALNPLSATFAECFRPLQVACVDDEGALYLHVDHAGHGDELWRLEYGAAAPPSWTVMGAAGPPGALGGATLTWATAESSLLLFGGTVPGAPSSDVWRVRLR